MHRQGCLARLFDIARHTAVADTDVDTASFPNRCLNRFSSVGFAWMEVGAATTSKKRMHSP